MRIRDWSSDVCSTSLRVPAGMDGTVIDVRVFTREGVKKDKRALAIEEAELAQVRKDLPDQQSIFEDDIYDWMRTIQLGRASCRERVCPDVWIAVLVLTFKKQT